jgi:hypothetical protein
MELIVDTRVPAYMHVELVVDTRKGICRRDKKRYMYMHASNLLWALPQFGLLVEYV